MKILRNVLLVIVILLIVLLFARNIIIKTALQAGLKAITGVGLSIKKMDIGIFKTVLDIKELKLYNPEGFPEKLMVHLPEIYADYDLIGFLEKRVHFNEIRINLKELIVIKNVEGRLNLESLKVPQHKEDKPVEEQPKKKKEDTAKMDFKIDTLELKIGKVIFKDYSKADKPRIKTYDINLNERHENIDNPQSLIALIIFKALTNTAISGILDVFEFDNIKNLVGETLQKTTKQATKVVEEVSGQVQEKGKEAIEALGGTIKSTTEKLKGIVPFGKN